MKHIKTFENFKINEEAGGSFDMDDYEYNEIIDILKRSEDYIKVHFSGVDFSKFTGDNKHYQVDLTEIHSRWVSVDIYSDKVVINTRSGDLTKEFLIGGPFNEAWSLAKKIYNKNKKIQSVNLRANNLKSDNKIIEVPKKKSLFSRYFD